VRKGELQKSVTDIDDLYARDLPGVISAVQAWLELQVDSRLLKAVEGSWKAQHYGNAIRDAFICLEEVLRSAAELDSSKGLTGDKLVTAAFATNGTLGPKIPQDEFMGKLTGGEMKGLEYLLRGGFLLFRNATAHRNIQYSRRGGGRD
jgi:hypothetical protein